MTNELTLYHEDRPAWIALVAPHMPAVIDANSDEELRRGWATMERDFQTATWARLNHSQRDRVRRLRKVAA